MDNMPHILTGRLSTVLLLATLTSLFSGCASYYNHYAVFPADNSSGESRQVKLSWQTAEYPDWGLFGNQSTPITVETQCSSRVWRLADDSHDNEPACGSGIRACGQPGMDLVAETGEPAGADTVCMAVNPGEEGAQVADIGGSLSLLVRCAPVKTERQEGEETINMDYVRASPVPYNVHIRKSPRGSLTAQPPELDDSVCDEE